MASSESVNCDGLVASRENLRQNVLLATSRTIDTANGGVVNSKLDLSHIDENASEPIDEQMKRNFWRNFFNFKSKQSNKNVHDSKRSTDLKCSEHLKEIQNRHVIGSVTSLTKKHQIDAEKCQINSKEHHNLDDTGDCISELIGHIGTWQVVWVIFLIMFQVPSAFHIFSFMFQVSIYELTKKKLK